MNVIYNKNNILIFLKNKYLELFLRELIKISFFYFFYEIAYKYSFPQRIDYEIIDWFNCRKRYYLSGWLGRVVSTSLTPTNFSNFCEFPLILCNRKNYQNDTFLPIFVTHKN